MNPFKRMIAGLGAQTAPFGFALDDPSAATRAGWGVIGDMGANLVANNQGGVDGFANLGASLQQAKTQGIERNRQQFTAQQLMEEAAMRKKDRERQDALSGEWQKWVGANSDKFGEYAGIAPYLEPSEGMRLLSGMKPDWRPATPEEKAALGVGDGTPLVITADGPKVLGGGNTNITVEGNKYGTIPPGFQLIQEGNSVFMEPIPGSPAATEAETAAQAKDAKNRAQVSTADMMVEDIDRTLDVVSSATLPTTGVIGSGLKNVGGTAAADVSKLLVGIKANIGFDRLQRMREESPTGGALGQVAVQELESLQSIYGSLEQSQSQDQLVYNLKRLKNKYLDVVHGEGNGPPREQLRGNSAEGKTSSGVPWRVE